MHPISPTLLLTMRNLLLLLLLFVLTPFTTKAQKLEFNGEFLLFREAKTKQPVLIINDSLVYKGNAMKRIAFKHTEYPAKLQEYDYFNIGEKTYLVHKGCGPVLEYRNDSIVRIDDSFLHRNQFSAVHFVYNNEIYFFGGYGLFTTKNILIKYNFKTKDWIEVQTYSIKALEPRAAAYSYLKGDNLYVFGGAAKDENEVTANKLKDNKVWRLHLPTMQWNCSGIYKKSALTNDNLIINQDSKKLYIIGQYFLEFDYNANKIYTNYRNYFPEILSCYIEDEKIIGAFIIGHCRFFYIGDVSEFKGKLKTTSVFITPLDNHKYNLKIALISLLVIIVLLYLFKTQLKLVFKPFKGIVYNQRKKVFTYKGKKISIFEDQDKKILLYLLEHLNKYVSLNELNQLFENNIGTESISATVKRREQAITVLLQKVSKITRIDEQELILERKNMEDKRIKDILLLPKLLKKGE